MTSLNRVILLMDTFGDEQYPIQGFVLCTIKIRNISGGCLLKSADMDLLDGQPDGSDRWEFER